MPLMLREDSCRYFPLSFFLFLCSLIITGFINKKSSVYCSPTVLLRSYRYRCIIPKLVPSFCPEKINQPIGVLRNPGNLERLGTNNCGWLYQRLDNTSTPASIGISSSLHTMLKCPPSSSSPAGRATHWHTLCSHVERQRWRQFGQQSGARW